MKSKVKSKFLFCHSNTVPQFLIFGIIGTIFFIPAQASSQPFLNSLAVLFRARPPHPHMYAHSDPSTGKRFTSFGKQLAMQAPIPSTLVGGSSQTNGKKGILIAKPIPTRPSPNQFQFQQPQLQSHYIKTFPNQQLKPFFSHPIDNSRTPAQTQFHHQHMQVSSQSQFIPFVPTTVAPLHGSVRFPDTSTSTTAVPPASLQNPLLTSGNFEGKKNQEEFMEVSAQTQVQNDGSHREPMEDSEEIASNRPQQSKTVNSQSHYSKSRFEEGGKKSLEFRPSPMLSTSGSEYIQREYPRNYPSESYDTKSSASFHVADAKDPPRYESGFKPLSYHQYASDYGTTASHNVYQNSYAQWNHSQWNSQRTTTMKTTTRPLVQESRIVTQISSSMGSGSGEEIRTPERDTGRYLDVDQIRFAGTPSSSEKSEDWVNPKQIPQKYKEGSSNQYTGFRAEDKSSGNPSKFKQNKFPVYNKIKDKPHVRVRPSKCEKFHRYGFCPVTHHYPLSQVERIAARCSALLSHLIAPLPKTEVHYDIVMTRNTSRKTPRLGPRQKMGPNRGWSWKDFKGSPVCDTEEVKITPGWAKNEEGEWLVILQTEIWKQEAQISICSFPHESESFQRHINNMGTKCVQRFTAQRLAVLDPENQDRCPIIRSVFLPSACVCLSERGSTSMETESVTGSVIPNPTSSEEDRDRYHGGSGEVTFISPLATAPMRPSVPILIQNGTFTTTLVVTENSQSENYESTPTP